jgi:hypothetical protein
MNFKKQARQLEQFLEEEFKKTIPIALLPDGSLAYKDFIIKKNKTDQWQISRARGLPLDTFNIKTCAVIAARLYGSNKFERYSELKILDQLYHKNHTDAMIFMERFKATKDIEKRDLYIARYSNAEKTADYAKKQIASRFKLMF